MQDYYELFGLQSTARKQEIQKAYSLRRKELLSDSSHEAQETLTALDQAYATLIDPNHRANYDRSLGFKSASGGLILAKTEIPSVLDHQEPPNLIVYQQCPHCDAPNPKQATRCMECGLQISRPCPKCGQGLPLGQTICERCETFIPEYDQRRFTEAITTQKRVTEERITEETKVRALEATHDVNRATGTVFWLIVIGICIVITLIAIGVLEILEQGF